MPKKEGPPPTLPGEPANSNERPRTPQEEREQRPIMEFYEITHRLIRPGGLITEEMINLVAQEQESPYEPKTHEQLAYDLLTDLFRALLHVPPISAIIEQRVFMLERL